MGKVVKKEELVKTGLDALDLAGRPGETLTYVFYDIEKDKIRNRVGSVCKDYGLERIQFSGFIGYLSRNRREELAVKLRDKLDKGNGKILIQPVCEKDFREYREFIDIGEEETEEPKEGKNKKTGGDSPLQPSTATRVAWRGRQASKNR